MPGGRLVIGGAFSEVGGVTAHNVAVWDGANWAPLGSGLICGSSIHQLGVRCLAADGGGGLYAGGGVIYANLTPLRGIAHWDGVAWHDVGGGVGYFGLPGQVNDIAFTATGMVVCGSFDEAGGAAANHIARWDGVSWSTFGSGLSGGANCLHASPSGDVYVGGYFRYAGGIDSAKVARWDGQGWASLHAPFLYPTDYVSDITMRANGALVVAGAMVVPSHGIDGLAEWDGLLWSAPLPWSGTVASVEETATGQLMTAGDSDRGLHLVAVTSGGLIGFPDGVGFDVPGLAVCTRRTGGYYVLGPTSLPGGVSAPAGLSLFDGGTWHSLASSVLGNVLAMIERPNGELVVAGDFHAIDGVVANNLAVWNGSSWSQFGGGTDAGVLSIDSRPDGRVLVGGRFTSAGGTAVGYVAEWDGQVWRDLQGGADFHVHAVRCQDGGGLLIGGLFSQAGGLPANKVARLDANGWSSLGNGLAEIPNAVVGLPTGGVLAATHSSSWLWEASTNTWTQRGPATVAGFTCLPTGEVIGSVPVSGSDDDYVVSVWQEAAKQWGARTANANGRIHGVALAADGRVIVVGEFTRLGDEVAMHVGEAMPSCAATAVAVGAGCGASPGPLEIEVVDLPWMGHEYRATCSGIASGAAAWTLFGYDNPMLPLSTISPIAGAGCALLCDNGVGILETVHANQVVSQLRTPNNANLVGVTGYHQVLELSGVGGVPQSLRSSNAIKWKVGAFF